MNTRHNQKSNLKTGTLISTLAVLSVILAACTAAASPTQAPEVASPTDTQVPVIASPTDTQAVPSSSEAVIDVAADPVLGQILVDGNGMTVYILTRDGPDQSNCDAGCLENWPPLLTLGSPTLGSSVDSSKIGSATLADGTTIVTYNHMPLYTFIKDTKPGDTTGQGVGDVWFVISPQGSPVLAASEATPTVAAAASVTEPTIAVTIDPMLGEILVDGNGMTLYVFLNDSPDQSNCTGNCLVNWPPLLTLGSPILGTGADDSKVGTARLTDGTLIVTYNHRPLYYYAQDTQPGNTNGQGVGNVWYVVDHDGDVIGR